MSSYLGVDWASGCWVVVGYGDDPMISTEPSILNVWHEYGDDAETILVDIPIGLPEEGTRDCDDEAKERLGTRGSTVFSVPCRAGLNEREYESAKEINEDQGSGGLGSQTWGLIPRIREVDTFLEHFENAQEKVFESHPEVCFAQFAHSDDDLPAKNAEGGIQARIQILKDVDTQFGRTIDSRVDEIREEAEWHHRIQSGRIDDVVDAAVLALTAKHISTPFPTLSEGAVPSDGQVIVHPGA